MRGNLKCIIIVEDSDAVRNQIKSWIADEPITIIEAVDGQDGYEKIKKLGDEIDLIISDVKMPNLDGISMLEKLCLENICLYTPKVILTTEPSAHMLKNKGEIKNLKIWVVKPLNKERFLSVLKVVL